MEPMAFFGAEPHLLGHEVGVCPHPLGVAAGEPVVVAELGDEPEQLLGRLLRSGVVEGAFLDVAGQLTR